MISAAPAEAAIAFDAARPFDFTFGQPGDAFELALMNLLLRRAAGP